MTDVWLTKSIRGIDLSAFRKMLSLGKSLPWPDVLSEIADTKSLSSEPIIAYFKPLEDWLDEHRKLNNYQLGWD